MTADRKRRLGLAVRSLTVADDGHCYRLAYDAEGKLITASRYCSAGGEFYLDPWGRRAARLHRLAMERKDV